MTDVETVALAILNSDRMMAGLSPVSSRDNIPDSDGYVTNAAAALSAATPGIEARVRAECAAIAKGFDAPHLNGAGERIADAIERGDHLPSAVDAGEGK